MVKIVPQKHGGSIRNWEPGESGNPKGKPKRGVALINAQLLQKGIEPISKTQAEDIMLNLMNMKKSELIELANNPDTPFLVTLCVNEMIAEGKGFSAMNVMLDRGIRKAIQRNEDSVTHLGAIEIIKPKLEG